jgi:Predicted ATPase (AAA+ superfamily)
MINLEDTEMKLDFDYKPRLIDQELKNALSYTPWIVVHGPKWCGKTTSCKVLAETVYELHKKKDRDAVSLYLSSDPSLMFSKKMPLLFDEWQDLPELWDETRSEVDEKGPNPKQVLFTGSKELTKKQRAKIHHTGAGRKKDLFMHPMSLFESGESNGSVSLLDLFDENFDLKIKESALTIRDYAYLVSRGGFPEAVSIGGENAIKRTRDYVDSLINDDDSDETVSEEGKDPEEFFRDPVISKRFLYSYGRNIASTATSSRLLKDVRGGEELKISEATFYNYRHAFERMFVIDDVAPWTPIFTSKDQLIMTPKRSLCDPSIGVHAMGVSPADLLDDPFDFGHVFEALCLRDLRVYSEVDDGTMAYYHRRNGDECDAVVTLRDGRYVLIEIKLGGDARISEGKENLLKIKKDIQIYNETKPKNEPAMRLPSSLILITGGALASKDPNGIFEVPIGCLRP